MEKRYLIGLGYGEDIIIEIEQKDRLNNPTDDELINEYLEREYGEGIAEVTDLDDLEVIKL